MEVKSDLISKRNDIIGGDACMITITPTRDRLLATQDQSFTKDIQDNTSTPTTTKPKPILKKFYTTKDPQTSRNVRWDGNLHHKKPISDVELKP